MAKFNFIPAENLLSDGVILVNEFEDKTKKAKKEIWEIISKHQTEFEKVKKRVTKLSDKFDEIEIDFDDDATDSEIDSAENRLGQLANAFEDLFEVLGNLEEIEIYD